MSNSKFDRLIKNPFLLVPFLDSKINLRWIPDSIYLKLIFRGRMGKKLNLKDPKTFNEKLQWLKLYDRKSIYTKLVDKYEVRRYIENTIGKDYLIPLLGVYNSFDEITFDELPNQFVLKCTHDSGGVIICKDKNTFNQTEAKNKINKLLKKNYYWPKREWPYKDVEPRIICEQYMEDDTDKELKDYKFFCFNGEPKVFFVASERGHDTKFDFYDLEFNHLPIKNHYKNSEKELSMPINFDEMLNLSRELSRNIPHVRIDFYEVNGRIYFGEITFYHFSGLVQFEPEEYDDLFGEWIKLPIQDYK